jgi:tetratricopeptide (TPR) repeat protein/tRNA A-37 threonylcarbamoyl transferase component Bud32/TolB-like protein
MDALRAKLESALAGHYTFERELGGGGMSRTYLVREEALNRRVVVKVLAPELLAGISVERFRREILLAAQLQHPHIVPVLTAGDAEGLPWFTMPYVDGDSLRHRLDTGSLDLAEAVSILRDVARALAYAHNHGIVHRDIKPDNVLLSSGSATVTDFGIAKAITAARTGGDLKGTALTQAGMSIGTPAYLAPEQALGDPETDHRADFYAFGVMAYELITGRMPFEGASPSKLLAAHMGDPPPDLLTIRPDCPPALAALVMSCLAKAPSARPHDATEIVRTLDSVTTSGSGTTVPAILQGGQIRLGRAIAIWAGATALVALTAWAARSAIGLPDWVFPGSVGVMLAGLPVIGFTVFAQRTTHRLFTATPGKSVPQGTMATLAIKASPHLSWRRTWLGGGIAVGAFAALVVAFMVMRALGIGPMASLRGKGDFGERETIMIADFRSPAGDSTLGATVAEALRTDLAQSSSLKVMTRSAIRELLGLMKRPADTVVGFDLAREIATREGAKAVLDGGIERLGSSYVVSARLVGTLDGRELALFREEAAGQDQLLPAVGKLSRQMRTKAGESLKTIRTSSELERVTTGSLPALRKYVEGSRLADEQGDPERGIALLREAVELDTSFAMAWRKLSVLLGNEGNDRSGRIAAISTAFRHRERLTEMERLLTEAYYYMFGPTRDIDRALSAYRAAIVLDSTSTSAINNSAVLLGDSKGDYQAAESLYRRVVKLPRKFGGGFTNLVIAQIRNGRLGSLDSTVRLFRETLPASNEIWEAEWYTAVAKGQLDRADSIARVVAAAPKTVRQANRAASSLSGVAELEGRLRDARQWQAKATEALIQADRSALNRLKPTLDTLYFESGYDGNKALALAAWQRGLTRVPMAEIPAESRPWPELYDHALSLRDPKLMREVVVGLERDWISSANDQVGARAKWSAGVALTEARWADAIRDIDVADRRVMVNRKQAAVIRGLAYRELGQADSAIASFEHYLATPDPFLEFDPHWKVMVLQNLGELYEAKGDAKKAIDRYGQITQLWAKADPSLEPRVKALRQRIAKLVGDTG